MDILTGNSAQGGAVVRKAIVKAQDPEQAAHRLQEKLDAILGNKRNSDLVLKAGRISILDKAFCLSTEYRG